MVNYDLCDLDVCVIQITDFEKRNTVILGIWII